MARDRVKSAAVFFTLSPIVAIALFSGLGGGIGSVHAQEGRQSAPLLFGGDATPRKAPVRLDPVLPHGEMRPATRDSSSNRHCSARRPVCVASDDSWTEALERLERAYEEHRLGLSLPSGGVGKGGPLIWELGPGRLRVESHLVPSRGFDRGRAVCLGGAPTLESARRCVAEAAVVALAPAGASWLRHGYGASQARAWGAAPVSCDARRRAQKEPESGLLTSTRQHEHWATNEAHELPRARSALLFDYLDAHSPAPLGHAGFLALSLAVTKTPEGALRFEAEPDLVDVLSSTVRYDPTALARWFDDVARWRFFQTRPAAESDWTLSSDSLPRSVAFSRPLEPTGSASLRVSLQPQHRDRTIAFKMTCEAPVSYVWSIIRVGEAGKPSSFVPVGYLHRGRGAEARVTPQEGTRELVLVGTNMGGVDLAHPFDPDHEPHEAHGCQVYVSPLDAGSGASSTP